MEINLINPALPGQKSATTQAAPKDEKLWEIAQNFESFYMYQVLELMQPPPSEDALFGGGFAEQMFRHTLNEQTASNITNSGGVGLADSIYQQLTRYQEVQ